MMRSLQLSVLQSHAAQILLPSQQLLDVSAQVWFALWIAANQEPSV